jgi:hypothetical protein
MEIAAILSPRKKSFLLAPGALLKEIERIFLDITKRPLSRYFETRAVLRATVREEHASETISFVENYPVGNTFPSYALLLEDSQVFISGDTALNEEFLHRYGMTSQIVLHSCSTDSPYLQPRNATLDELQTLPVYLQQKLWLYGYGSDYASIKDPLPMLFLPQGTCLYDSTRKEKHLEKTRFIRESAKRVQGNSM